MKVLHLLQNYYPSIGGTQIFFQKMSEGLVQNYGDEVEVYTTDSYYGPDKMHYKPITPLVENINGVKITRFKFLHIHKPAIKLINKVSAKLLGKLSQTMAGYLAGPISVKMARAIRFTDADIIVGSSNGYWYMRYPLIRKNLAKAKPFVFQGAIHFDENDIIKSVTPKMIEAIKASEYYLANTEYEKAKLIQLGVCEDKIVVVGSAVALKDFENADKKLAKENFSLSDDDFTVGYLGRLEATKSINVLIDAFVLAKQKFPRLKLVIAGFKSSYAQELEALISKLSSESQASVKLLYNITYDEKKSLCHAIDLLVLPSLNESFGMVFLEAWSCKKPVIGAAIGAIKSVIDDGVDGLLMRPNDARDLADKILIVCENDSLRKDMGKNGYSKTAANYTWPVVISKYREVYKMAIEKFNNRMHTVA